MLKTVFYLLLICSFSSAFAQFPIREGNLWGYINAKGNIAVKPQFYAAKPFVEGVAAVREERGYGFINEEGKFIIAPKYDYANSFSGGLAKVFINGKPFFINEKGNIVFQHNYAEIADFGKNSFSIVKTHSEKYGVINNKGNLLIDTTFKQIDAQKEGVFVVTGLNDFPYSKDSTQKLVFENGIMDSLGNWVVKFGKYAWIRPFVNRYTFADLLPNVQNGAEMSELIDEKGNSLWTVNENKWRLNWLDSGFYQEITEIELDTLWKNEENVVEKITYKGCMNLRGEMLFSDIKWSEISPFSNNRAFAKRREDDKWILINTKGEIIENQAFDDIIYEYQNDENAFLAGRAFVKIDRTLRAIDTMGNWVSEPLVLDDSTEIHSRIGNVIILHQDWKLAGFWNAERNILVKPRFSVLHKEDFGQELILAERNHKMLYVNLLGEIIWEEDTTFWKENKLNIDFMLDSKFQIEGEHKPAYLGGIRANYNPQKRIYPDIPKKAIRLFCHISENEPAIFREKYKGMKFYIVNLERDSLYFSEYATNLYANLQARNEKGEWQDIDFDKGGFCGNGYQIRALAPDKYWEFSVPIHAGEFQTKMRVKLAYKKAINQEKSNVMYSNEVDAWINKAQFWNKQGYFLSEFYEYY
jgi:hypothetical protein